MNISFEVPPAIEEQLRNEFGDLSQVAKETILIEMYRRGGILHSKLAECLGISRYELDGLLKRHGVTEDLITLEEFRVQAAQLRNR